MRKPIIHILFWIIFFFIWNRIFYFYIDNPLNRFYFTFLDISLIVATFYIVFGYLMPAYLKRKSLGLFALSLLGLAISLSVLYSFIMWLMLVHNLIPIHFNFEWTYKDLQYNRFFIALLAILAGCSVKLAIDRLEASKQIEQMEKEKSIAELTYLKAQINPHFLFNSLNSLYAQMESDSKDAKNTLTSLADLLRYQLYDCNADSISLAKETAYLKNYFNLQQMRNDNCQTELLISEPVTPLFIAPLLLMPFIENAFKYVSDNDNGKNFILASLKFEGNKLYFHCKNTFDSGHMPDTESKGIGLMNVKKRLELIYHNNYHLQVTVNDNWYETQLTIILK